MTIRQLMKTVKHKSVKELVENIDYYIYKINQKNRVKAKKKIIDFIVKEREKITKEAEEYINSRLFKMAIIQLRKKKNYNPIGAEILLKMMDIVKMANRKGVKI